MASSGLQAFENKEGTIMDRCIFRSCIPHTQTSMCLGAGRRQSAQETVIVWIRNFQSGVETTSLSGWHHVKESRIRSNLNFLLWSGTEPVLFTNKGNLARAAMASAIGRYRSRHY